MICRNFSANDGMFPGQRPGQQSSNGVIQGLPVAIGTGRRSNRSSGASYATTNSDGTSSGGDSPKSMESSFDHQLHRVIQQTPRAAARRTHHREDTYRCLCGRGPVRSYGFCGWCLNEKGWA
nr:hypothetical protein CFP56_00637 [Quercus suber]